LITRQSTANQRLSLYGFGNGYDVVVFARVHYVRILTPKLFLQNEMLTINASDSDVPNADGVVLDLTEFNNV